MRKGFSQVLFSMVLVLVFCLVVPTSVFADKQVLHPIADSFVRDGDVAEVNYGSEDRLEVKWEAERGGMTRISFITFDISDLASVQSAVFRFYVDWADVLEVRDLEFWSISDAWLEDEITWENAPLQGGTLIGTVPVVSLDDLWYEINVTNQVLENLLNGSSTFSIRIENLDDHWGGLVYLSSREGENPPQLVIEN